MTDASTGQRIARHFPRADGAHAFVIGQSVRLKGGFGRTPTEIYQVTAMLPPRANSAREFASIPHTQ